MAVSFRKEKLSRAALDDLARMYSRPVSEEDTVMYTLSSGTRIPVSRLRLLTGTGSFELKYLLGQTYPFHFYYGKGEADVPVTDMIFVVNEDGKKEPWTRNPEDLKVLLYLGIGGGVFATYKSGETGKMMFQYTGEIPPITYTEDGRIDGKTLDEMDRLVLGSCSERNLRLLRGHAEAFEKIGTRKQRLQFLDHVCDFLKVNDVGKEMLRGYIEQTSNE